MDLVAVAGPEPAGHDAHIPDVADDAPVTDPVLPAVVELGPGKRLADVARIAQRRDPRLEEARQASARRAWAVNSAR
jgi:hypothetical protein